MKKYLLSLAGLVLLGLLPSLACAKAYTAFDQKACAYRGIPLYGKVKVVEYHPDLKVQIVDNFPDLKVKVVESNPHRCGKWQYVQHNADFKIKFVEHFPDIKVKFVEHFPGT